MPNWLQAFDLLDIRTGGPQASAGRRPRERWNAKPGPGWSNKDDQGGSSIAESNRETKKEQMADKAREEYEREQRKAITNDLQESGDTGRNPLSDEDKELRDKYVETRMQKYDEKIGTEEAKPDDQSRQAAGVDPEAKREAKEAVKSEFKSQTKGDQNNDNFSANSSTSTLNFDRDSEDDVSDEAVSEAKPPESTSPDESTGQAGSSQYASAAELTKLREDFEEHRSDGNTHYAG